MAKNTKTKITWSTESVSGLKYRKLMMNLKGFRLLPKVRRKITKFVYKLHHEKKSRRKKKKQEREREGEREGR